MRYTQSSPENVLEVQNNTVHLALAIWDLTDDYNRHAGVTLYSFLEHCAAPVVVHFLHDERLEKKDLLVAKSNKQKYLQIANVFGATVCYHHVEVPDWCTEVPAVQKWTAGSLMRLWLPECLLGVSRVIYLDCDIVVNTDILALWNCDLQGKSIAAVLDSNRWRYSKKCLISFEKMNISWEMYFCAGILLFDLDNIRSRNIVLSRISLEFLIKFSDVILYPDQDMLNHIFQDDISHLEEKYNIYPSRPDSLKYKDDAILHYAGPLKPWNRYLGEIDDLYWHYLFLTPWGGGDMIYSYVRAAPDLNVVWSYLEDELVLNLPIKSTIFRLLHFQARVWRRKMRNIIMWLIHT